MIRQGVTWLLAAALCWSAMAAGGEVERERARRLMERVASGGAPLSDEEFQVVMAASHTDEV